MDRHARINRRKDKDHYEERRRHRYNAAFIAYQRGKNLTWDPGKREFTNDDIANRMRSRALREPWRV